MVGWGGGSPSCFVKGGLLVNGISELAVLYQYRPSTATASTKVNSRHDICCEIGYFILVDLCCALLYSFSSC